jgi:cell division protein FtsW (lipid II flippase)
MGATFVSVQARSRLAGGSGLVRQQLLLLAISLVSMLAIGLCYAGKMRAFTAAEERRSARTTVNLSDIREIDALEAALLPAFEQVNDRRFAARELRGALYSQDDQLTLSHVGVIARLTVPVVTIDRTRNLGVFAERLRDARALASASKTAPPTNLPVFTAADVAVVKPAFVVRTIEEHRRAVVWCAVAILLGFQAVSLFWLWRGVTGDRLLLSAAHLLTMIGFVMMVSRPDPLRDSLLIVRYTQSVLMALGLCFALSTVNVRTATFLRLSYVSLASAVLLAVLLVIFGSGPGTSGAKVNLGPVQPIEAIRLLILLFLAGYLGRRWELVRQIRETDVRGRRVPDWLDLPRLDHVLPVFGGVGISLVLFFALRDLGPALVLSLIFLAMLALARARVVLVAAGIAVLAAGFYGGYWMGVSKTLTARVSMWQSPWNNVVRGGDQIAHAAWAIATGGLEGTGVGLGDTRYLPAGHTDLVLAAVGEELGAVGIFTVLTAFGVIVWRGLRIARGAATDTAVFLAVAMTLSIAAPMLVIAAGILGLIPLTGVVTPFMSYGGSAMLGNFAALGLLAAIGSSRGDEQRATPFHVPLRWLGGALMALAAVVLIAWGRVQVLDADAYLIKPQLSVQADGVLRYQYNPRVLAAVRILPRGDVFDRRDIPLAARAETTRTAERDYARMHVSLREACPNPQERCYPFGGSMFHLLGDANTQANWSASNTSYVERDQEDRLRGFDDRATLVRTGDDGPMLAVRRDYRDLVPLVRHRWEPAHPDVRALMSQPRNVRLTIDARLQADVASIVARSSAAAGIQHAAVVVLDAETGELLASVSYPWPDAELAGDAASTDATLDRARYGMYAPGSTFKLVTAAAALRKDPGLSRLAFTCSPLPGDRVGAKIPGFTRPVRDDVLDRHPHGTLTMHDGLVRSCNAYFAQLAVRLGTPALASAAAIAGISYPTTGPPDRVRENLPYSGYGQGRVLATPLRMARVAAAIGTDGTIREPSIVSRHPPGLGAPQNPRTPEPQNQGKVFLSEDSARILAGYMRDVVTDGTGRLLKNHPFRIAGKTGTAEVDGAKSHAWFIGFAPAGPATHRIAFAVILENAGYGGASAAAVAGQVVTAAASVGLVK